MVLTAALGLLAAILAGSARAGLVYPDCANGPLKSNLVCNTSATPEARAAALVAAMSNSDKLANLINNSHGVSKLGLSAYQWWNEALHGVAHNRGITWAQSGDFSAATQFPQAITSGAAFDDALIEQIGIAVGTEARAFANAGRAHLDFWTPDINPFRDPRWGRGHETPGEDPFRNAKFAEAFVRGMQGTAATKRVIATCKHFAAYDLEGGGSTTRFNFDAKISQQELVEYYLPPFKQCARDSKVGSIMCAYNAVNGVPACADSYMMDTILRKHWGWEGEGRYVVSDCDAVYYVGNANGGHRYKSSYSQAIGASFEAGVDNICWATGGTQPDPSGAFNQRTFSQATLDKMMTRQFEGLIRAGYFDGSKGMHRELGAKDVSSAANKDLALRAAREGIVLLKNDGNTLPLDLNSTGSNSAVAMIGFWANKADSMLGGYSGSPPFNHDPVTAAKSMGINVNYVSGPLTQGSADPSAAVAAAQKSKVIIFFGGIDNTVEKESTDKSSIAWPAGQLSMIQKLASLDKPVIVVKLGTHIDDTPLLSLPNVKSILWAGYPGQDGGTAVMDVITGAVAPAGRIPMTMYPSSYINQAPMTNMALRPSGSYPGRTYRWYNESSAVFSFGYGLHYTSFTATIGEFPKTFDTQELISTCNETYLDLCPFPSLPVTVNNTGPRTSDYVVLGFLAGTFGPTPYPIKTLATYGRLSAVNAGQSKLINLGWNLGNIARVDSKGNTVLYPGTYIVLLDQPTVSTLTFELTGKEVVLDNWPQKS